MSLILSFLVPPTLRFPSHLSSLAESRAAKIATPDQVSSRPRARPGDFVLHLFSLVRSVLSFKRWFRHSGSDPPHRLSGNLLLRDAHSRGLCQSSAWANCESEDPLDSPCLFLHQPPCGRDRLHAFFHKESAWRMGCLGHLEHAGPVHIPGWRSLDRRSFRPLVLVPSRLPLAGSRAYRPRLGLRRPGDGGRSGPGIDALCPGNRRAPIFFRDGPPRQNSRTFGWDHFIRDASLYRTGNFPSSRYSLVVFLFGHDCLVLFPRETGDE